MSKLVWDKLDERIYETGVDHGVLYPTTSSGTYGEGVVWNGLTAVNEKPTGAEASPLYADNIKYLNLVSVEEFEATIEAYTYPDEFKPCIGIKSLGESIPGAYVTGQSHSTFGFAYRSKIGDAVEGDSLGYKIHLVYGATASASEVNRETVNNDPTAMTFSWDITTVPVEIDDNTKTAHIIIDSREVGTTELNKLLDELYGTDTSGEIQGKTPSLPTPARLKEILTPPSSGT